MGGHMANNLIKSGFPMVIFDLSKETVARIKGNNPNVKVATSPKEVASLADQIVTMLPSSPHVQEVYTSGKYSDISYNNETSIENGILASAKKNSLMIDASTIDPNVAREVAAKVRAQGSMMVDAPVSGGLSPLLFLLYIFQKVLVVLKKGH